MPCGSGTEISPQPRAARSASRGSTTRPDSAPGRRARASRPRRRRCASRTGSATRAAGVARRAGGIRPARRPSAPPRTRSRARASFDGSAAMRPQQRRRRMSTCASARSGDSGSGSGIRMSRPIAAGRVGVDRAAPAAASSVRGHGHWPSAARLLSSISTIVTGVIASARGDSPAARRTTRLQRQRARRDRAPARCEHRDQDRGADAGAARAVRSGGVSGAAPVTRSFPSRRRRRTRAAAAPVRVISSSAASPPASSRAPRRRAPARGGTGTGAAPAPAGTARRRRCCSNGPSRP